MAAVRIQAARTTGGMENSLGDIDPDNNHHESSDRLQNSVWFEKGHL